MRFGVFNIGNLSKARSLEDLKKLEELRAVDVAEQRQRGQEAAARVTQLAAQHAEALKPIAVAAPAKPGRRGGQTALGPPTHIYRVQMRSGAWWKKPKYFHASTEHTRTQWLYNIEKRGGRAYEVDLHSGKRAGVAVDIPSKLTRRRAPLTYEQAVASGAEVPQQPKRQPTVESVELQRIQQTRKVVPLYVRLGDKVTVQQAGAEDNLEKQKGLKQFKALKEMEASLDTIDTRLAQIGKELQQAEKLNDPSGVPALVEERVALHTNRLSVKEAYDKLLNAFTKLPGTGLIARVMAVKDEIRQAKKEGREWIDANPKLWASMQAEHARKAKKIRKLIEAGKIESKRMPSEELAYPPETLAKLNTLKWKLKGLSGKAHYVEKKAKVVGVGKHIVLSASEEKAGVRPEEGVVTYLLSTGQWKNTLDGRNVFNKDEAEALYEEYAGVINNIVNGGARGGGWAKLFDLKDLADDLRGHLNEMLLTYAREYTRTMAEDAQEGRGVIDPKTGKLVDQGMPRNFRSFIISRLHGESRNFMRNRLQEARDRREASEGEIAEYEQALSWDEEGALTPDQLRSTHAPMGTHYLPADDVVALHELRDLLNTRVKGVIGTGQRVTGGGSSDDFAVALFSRLNLHNPVSDPKGEGKGGLKSWDEVAADVLTARRTRFLKKLKAKAMSSKTSAARRDQLLAEHANYTANPNRIPDMQSAHSLKQEIIQSLGRMFSLKAAQRAAAEGGFGEKSDWLGEMTASDMRSLKHGLQTIIKVAGSPSVAPSASLPTRAAWKVTRQPVTGEGKQAKPGRSVAVPVLSDVHRVVPHDPKMGEPVTGSIKYVPLLAHGGETALHFWRNQSRSKPGAPRSRTGAAYFDPAAELDLGMDLYGPAGMTAGLPTHVKIKQMRAAHLRKVWQAMDDLSDKQLTELSNTADFKNYSQQYEQAVSAAQAKMAAAYAEGVTPQKRTPLGVKPLRVGKVSIERVRPGDVVLVANLIQKQRAIDAGEDMAAKERRELAQAKVTKSQRKKGKKAKPDAELAALMAKLSRLLGVA